MDNIFSLISQGSKAYRSTQSLDGKLPFVSIAPVTEVDSLGRVKVAASEYGGLSATPPLFRACPTYGMTFPAPRVGDTILYSYLDGDPNQGVFWGHLQNALNVPAQSDRFTYILGTSIIVVQESQIDISNTAANIQVNEEKITLTVGECGLEVSATGVKVILGENTLEMGEDSLKLSSGVGSFNISGSSLEITGFTSVTIAGKEVATVGATSALQTITGKGW